MIVITLLMPGGDTAVRVLPHPQFENRHNCEVYVARVVLKDTDMTDVSVACLKARK